MIIVGLSLRLLVRWKRGYLHVHPHAHGPVTHAHPHVHEHAAASPHRRAEDRRVHSAGHEHHHADSLGRSPRAAYAIGLVHGIGGSAGIGVLVISSLPGQQHAPAALMVFAAATAGSMAAVSSAFGRALGSRAADRMERLTPSLGVVSLLFGAWYALGAAGAVPYLF